MNQVPTSLLFWQFYQRLNKKVQLLNIKHFYFDTSCLFSLKKLTKTITIFFKQSFMRKSHIFSSVQFLETSHNIFHHRVIFWVLSCPLQCKLNPENFTYLAAFFNITTWRMHFKEKNFIILYLLNKERLNLEDRYYKY